jgi:hypothetical protein
MSSYQDLLRLANQAKNKKVVAGPSNGSASSSKSNFVSGNKKLERKKPDPDVRHRLSKKNRLADRFFIPEL